MNLWNFRRGLSLRTDEDCSKLSNKAIDNIKKIELKELELRESELIIK